MTTPSAKPSTLRRMRESAMSRIRDAKTLRQSDPLGDRSDSDILLDLLALELLLKCVLLLNGAKPGRFGHAYEKLFDQLPAGVRADVLTKAKTRIGPGSGLDADYPGVLERLGRNFIELRYPYEAYEDVTDGEYVEMGEEWIALGAPLESATVTYYPSELFGLLEALTDMTASLAS